LAIIFLIISWMGFIYFGFRWSCNKEWEKIDRSNLPLDGGTGIMALMLLFFVISILIPIFCKHVYWYFLFAPWIFFLFVPRYAMRYVVRKYIKDSQEMGLSKIEAVKSLTAAYNQYRSK